MHIDFETYSEVGIKKAGAWSYSRHPSTEVICMAYAQAAEPPRLWTNGSPLPVFITDEQENLHAWNSFFEWCIWHNTLNWPDVPISRWNDTAALAAALALPRKLEDCGAALHLPQDSQKDKRGKYLIHRLCKPNRGKRNQDPELLEELYEYCKQDVVAERTLHQKLWQLSPKERTVWELDQKINIRGFYVDLLSVERALRIVDSITERLNHEITQLTNGVLTNTLQRQKILDYVTDELNYPLEKFDKNYLAKVLEDIDLPPIARRVIEIRQILEKPPQQNTKL